MRSYQGIIFAAVCLLYTAAAQAQIDTPALAPPPPSVAAVAPGDPHSNSLHQGVWSLSFKLPTGGSPWLDNSVGAWYMLHHQLNLGLNLALNIDPEQGTGTTTTAADGTVVITNDTFVNVTFVVAPALKYYFTTSGPVAPYVLGQVHVGFARGTDGITNTGGSTAGVLSVAAGFGLEVFPWHFLSLGGTVGVNLDLLRPQAQQRSAALQTITTALYAAAYFD